MQQADGLQTASTSIKRTQERNRTHAYTRITALFPGLPRWAGTRKAKPVWILLKQETVSGNGISWAICKSAPCSRQTTTPAPHYSRSFTGQMPFLPPNQQRQSMKKNKQNSADKTIHTGRSRVTPFLLIFTSTTFPNPNNQHYTQPFYHPIQDYLP